MTSLCLGITAFALYFLYDVNSFLWQRSIPKAFFAVGTALLGASLALDLYQAFAAGAFAGAMDVLLLLLAAAGFAALLIFARSAAISAFRIRGISCTNRTTPMTPKG